MQFLKCSMNTIYFSPSHGENTIISQIICVTPTERIDGVLGKLIAGPVKILLFPKPKKERGEQKKKPKKEKKKPAKKKKASTSATTTQAPAKKKGGSVADFLPLVDVALGLLNDLRRKLRVDCLELKVVMAGGDPCDLAVNYGKAWAALGNLQPLLERVLVIKKRDIDIECDFVAPSTLITARVDITITLGRILALVAVNGFKAVKEFLKIMKKRKGGAAK